MRLSGQDHTMNVLFFTKIINYMSSVFLRIIVHKREVRAFCTPKILIPIELYGDTTRIKGMIQLCTTAQHNVTPDKDCYAIKLIDFLFVGEMIACSTFSSVEDLPRII
ncbi:hypothetical protein NPIL_157121 [Nephila pilipes]|uniref:Uncharacterized protein n=1 Tax=Nephila pilipes TaxID=299642 RepID=A0A8X6NR88_NEPPI|nr:hypothetical protein NPIL_157121 [Nephila pilipes]